MTGLRDRKKEALRHQIIQAAAGLIAEKGLDATTMEDVAAAADVSVATVYNYFGTKTALVIAGVEDDANRILEEGQAVLARPGRDAKRAVKKLIGIYVAHLTSWDRRLLTEVLGAMFRPGADDMAARLMQLDERSVAQLAQLIGHFQEEGLVAGNVESQEAALLLYSPVLTLILMWLSLEGFPIDELKAQVNRQIDLTFTGLHPRKA